MSVQLHAPPLYRRHKCYRRPFNGRLDAPQGRSECFGEGIHYPRGNRTTLLVSFKPYSRHFTDYVTRTAQLIENNCRSFEGEALQLHREAMTEKAGSSGDDSDLHSGGPRFEL